MKLSYIKIAYSNGCHAHYSLSDTVGLNSIVADQNGRNVLLIWDGGEKTIHNLDHAVWFSFKEA